MGEGLFLHFAVRTRARPSHQGPGQGDRPQAADRPFTAERHRPAGADPVQGHPSPPGRRHPQRLQIGHRSAWLRWPLHLRLPDQGEPAEAGGRGSARFRTRVRLWPGSGIEAGAAGGRGAGLQRHADHLQRLQGRRVHRDGDAGPEDRPHGHPGGREIHRARADPEVRRARRRPPADRDAGQAGGARRRPLAGLRGLPFEVRPDGRGGAARPRGAEVPRDGRLLQAAALPSRQPDPQHPNRQRGA